MILANPLWFRQRKKAEPAPVWRTFQRLLAEHNEFVNRAMAAVMRKFGRLGWDLMIFLATDESVSQVVLNRCMTPR
jgi:hypothetical protein